jgi:transcriptional regulator with XRE-family HTH domain
MENNIDFIAIGKRIKHKRSEMKLTQENLSETVGIGVQHLSKIENGKATFSLSCLVALANALQTTTDNLLMDNLPAAKSNLLGEVGKFFEDCTHDEIFIIMRTATALKESMRQKGQKRRA